MKKIYTISLLLILLGSGACKKLSDVAPLAEYTDKTVWSTKEDVVAAINGCYRNWEPSGFPLLFRDCLTDNEVNKDFFGTMYENFASGNYNPASITVSDDFYNYETINKCNWFLENVDRAGDDIVDADFKKRTKAEARFLRAYRYFLLSQFYRNVPLVLHTQTIDESRLQKQVSKAVITETILNELAAIAPDLPIEYFDSADKGRITRGAALALKARIELYSKKYDACIATCNQLMTAPFTYSLYSNFENLFRPQFENNAMNKEVILDAQYMLDYNQKNVLSALAIAPAGNSQIAVTQSLVDAFETLNGQTIGEDNSYNLLQPYQNRDPRLSATIIRPGLFYNGIFFDPITPPNVGIIGGPVPAGGGGPVPAGGGGPSSGYGSIPSNYKKAAFMNSPTGYSFKKYLANLNDYWNSTYGLNQLSNTGGNVIVIRYAEVLLTYAEAKIEAGQIDQSVYDAINKVRARVMMPEVNTSTHSGQTAMRELVRRERRVELAGEGLRWFDIVRWQIGSDVIKDVYDCLNGTVNRSNGMLTLIPNSSTVQFSRTFTPKYYVFPIPAKELQANTNLVQNTEY
ncbi:RagB/SusD family nutrient uptake outer membrane protein [Pedobacter borealis]|uniref:RagB/SusD family nutrient uptake outer membrane protein n=1 Tax=Pedobacter borealis TaxID=475254 RepID=UPI000493961C|nr:RagB/SusD family nutrient uptake outer membrane protein [Pedobacter borealis]